MARASGGERRQPVPPSGPNPLRNSLPSLAPILISVGVARNGYKALNSECGGLPLLCPAWRGQGLGACHTSLAIVRSIQVNREAMVTLNVRKQKFHLKSSASPDIWRAASESRTPRQPAGISIRKEAAGAQRRALFSHLQNGEAF